MYANGAYYYSDSNGQIIFNGSSPMRMEAYIIDDDLVNGYIPVIPFYIDFQTLDDFERTFFVLPSLNMPAPILLSGNIEADSSPLLIGGEIIIYAGDGRAVGGGEASGDGTYEGEVYTSGDLYFILEESSGTHFYTKINVEGSQPSEMCDVNYNGDFITFSGSAPGARIVDCYLQLGEELIYLDDRLVELDQFSCPILHEGSDVIRLKCELEDAYGNTYEYYDPVEYTASASGISYSDVFDTTSPVDPSSWTHNLSWDEVGRNLTWDSAGATAYEFEFQDGTFESYLYGLDDNVDDGNRIVDTLVDEFGAVLITATPVWSEEGYIPHFMPADSYSGLVIYYDALSARIMTDNDIHFTHFDAGDDPQTIASNSVTSIAVEGDGEDIGVVLVGTYGGGVSYFDGDAWGQFTQTEGLVSNSVRTIVIDYNAGGCWVGGSLVLYQLGNQGVHPPL